MNYTETQRFKKFELMVNNTKFQTNENFHDLATELISITKNVQQIRSSDLNLICELISDYIDFSIIKNRCNSEPDIFKPYKNSEESKEEDRLYEIEDCLSGIYIEIISHLKSITSLIKYKSKNMQELIAIFINCNDLSEMINAFENKSDIEELVQYLFFLNQKPSIVNCYSHIEEKSLFSYTEEIIYFKCHFESNYKKSIEKLGEYNDICKKSKNKILKRKYSRSKDFISLRENSLAVIEILKDY